MTIGGRRGALPTAQAEAQRFLPVLASGEEALLARRRAAVGRRGVKRGAVAAPTSPEVVMCRSRRDQPPAHFRQSRFSSPCDVGVVSVDDGGGVQAAFALLKVRFSPVRASIPNVAGRR